MGYLARSFVNIRFRNPVQASPLTPGERVYSWLSKLHLLSLRTVEPRQYAEMFIDGCKWMGFGAAEAASYALTPNSLGGCGLDMIICIRWRSRSR